MEIGVFEIEKWEKEAFEVFRPEQQVTFETERLTTDNVKDFRKAGGLCVFIYSDLSAAVLREMPDLKLIATRSTGVDHIDLDYCRERGITVCNVPVYGENTVAEHVFALLLAVSHKLVEAVDRTRRGDFSLTGLQGFDLQGKTLGVVGTGNIGQNVIRIARGFGMEVVAYDHTPREDLAGSLGFRYAQDLRELLEQADVITLHVPGTPGTRHLISADEFSRMKEGAVLINTSRGSVVDVKALLYALSEGRLRAAGLDVLSEEPLIREEVELVHTLFRERHDLTGLLADHILLRLKNVVITPHSAFYTCEALERILAVTIENIRAFLKGTPQNTV